MVNNYGACTLCIPFLQIIVNATTAITTADPLTPVITNTPTGKWDWLVIIVTIYQCFLFRDSVILLLA